MLLVLVVNFVRTRHTRCGCWIEEVWGDWSDVADPTFTLFHIFNAHSVFCDCRYVEGRRIFHGLLYSRDIWRYMHVNMCRDVWASTRIKSWEMALNIGRYHLNFNSISISIVHMEFFLLMKIEERRCCVRLEQCVELAPTKITPTSLSTSAGANVKYYFAGRALFKSRVCPGFSG